MRELVVLVVVVAGCSITGPDTGSDATWQDRRVPGHQTFVDLLDRAQRLPQPLHPTSLTIDLSDCRHELHTASWALGSRYVLAHRFEGGCELWIGGETEDPSYDGTPGRYCAMPRAGSVSVPVASELEDPRCVVLGARVPDRAAFEQARASAPVLDDERTLEVDVVACRFEWRTLDERSSAIVRPHQSRVCELFLERDGEPLRYCALWRPHQGALVATVQFDEHGAPTLDDPRCFVPAFD